ncbi:MAG: hypothetical protein NZM37_00780 [Sandaracinaceae bacterium]|nr:hypothetical protein [Sandaracinaceae bacterium]MDW8245663.1 hypothetical protein [Sandaracinaceae bacterium]
METHIFSPVFWLHWVLVLPRGFGRWAVGAYLILDAEFSRNRCRSGFDCVLETNTSLVALAVVMTGVMTLVGLPLVVSGVGGLVDGKGNGGAAFLGELIGILALVPVYAIALFSKPEQGLLFGALGLSAVFPLSGSIIGYEISDGSQRKASHSLSLVPWVDASALGWR